MSAYLIVDIEVKDAAGYEEYKRMAAESIRAFGGRYLVRGGAAEVLEGDWEPGRLVVLEFPGVERARAWWSSEEYRKAREIRLRTAGCRMVLVEGLQEAGGQHRG